MALVAVPDGFIRDGFEGLAARHPAMTRPLDFADTTARLSAGFDSSDNWRLFLVHLWAGIDAGKALAHRIMGGGWRGQILKKLTETLARSGE